MKNKVLVITNEQDDAHADALIQRCNDIGLEDKIIRLNTENFINNCQVKFDGDSCHVTIKDSQREFFSNEILSVWYRRPQPITVSNQKDSGVVKFIQEQATATMRGLFFLTHETAKWVNPIPALNAARHKIPQLSLAKQVGFSVPKTIVTNNKDDLKNFFSPNEIICNKSLDSPNYTIDGKMYPYLTKKFDNIEEIENELNSLEICPTMFQEYIDKDVDIRVVIMGEKITAVAIESQNNQLSQVDFRGTSPHLLKHTIHKLPHEIEKSVSDFVKKSNLLFSSMDLVLDKNGKYYFIENNCNGQWLWLDSLAGSNLIDDMIDLLFGNTIS